MHGNQSTTHHNCSHAVAAKKKLGDVTSLNVTMLRAGVQAGGEDVINVVPPMAEAAFDIRISPNDDPITIKQQLDIWCEEVSTTAGANSDNVSTDNSKMTFSL